MRCSTWETRGGRQQALCMLPEPGCTHGEEFPHTTSPRSPSRGRERGLGLGNMAAGLGGSRWGAAGSGQGLRRSPGVVGGVSRASPEPAAGVSP